MIEAGTNHFQVVRGSLAGEREVDERTFASVAVLGERLERVRGLGKAFSGISFSSAVEELAGRNSALPGS